MSYFSKGAKSAGKGIVYAPGWVKENTWDKVPSAEGMKNYSLSLSSLRGSADNIGRVDILFKPQADASNHYKSKISRRCFVVTGRNTTEILEFIEHALDQIALPVKDFIKISRVFTVGF